MEYTCNTQGSLTAIRFKGQFTFKDNQQFRQILTMLDQPGLRAMSLNFAQVEFVDSAALGMLLLLRDEAEARSISLELTDATGQTLKMFSVAKFNVIFPKQAS